MEDVATAEIARCQLWQWIRHGTPIAGGGRVTVELVRSMMDAELAALRTGRSGADLARLAAAAEVLETNALAEDLPSFFTTGAYARHLVSYRR